MTSPGFTRCWSVTACLPGPQSRRHSLAGPCCAQRCSKGNTFAFRFSDAENCDRLLCVCTLYMYTWKCTHMRVNIRGHHDVHMDVRVCGHMTGMSTHIPGAPRWGLLVPWSSVSTEYVLVSQRPPVESGGSCPLPHHCHLRFPKRQFPGPTWGQVEEVPGDRPRLSVVGIARWLLRVLRARTAV